MQNQLNQLKPQIAANVEVAYDIANLALSQVERATQLALEQTLKKAPEGSEAAVAAVKQAMDAGNKAVAEARKAAKKSAELAKANLDQLKAKAPAAKPARRR